MAGNDLSSSTKNWLLEKGRYGYIFEIDPESLDDVQPDEDSIGEAISENRYPWLDELAQEHLSSKGYRQVMHGFYDYWAKAGKKIAPHLTDDQIVQMIRDGAHIANRGTLKFKNIYLVDKLQMPEYPHPQYGEKNTAENRERRVNQIWNLLQEGELEVRHYGPGAHPGTGTPQTVHGGGRQARPESGLGEHRFGSPLDRNEVIFRIDPYWSEEIGESPEEHERKFRQEIEEALVEMEMALGFPVSGLTITNDLLELAVKRRGPSVRDNPSLREMMMSRLTEQAQRWVGAYNKGLVWVDTTPEVSVETTNMDSLDFHEAIWHEVGHYLTHWDGKSGLSPGWVMSMNDPDYTFPSNYYISRISQFYTNSKVIQSEYKADLIASLIRNHVVGGGKEVLWARPHLGLTTMNNHDQGKMNWLVDDLRKEMKLKHPDLFKEELLEERAKEPRTVLVAFPKAGEIVSVSPETAQELQDSDAVILFPFEK